mgnify:CR=1 FL=1
MGLVPASSLHPGASATQRLSATHPARTVPQTGCPLVSAELQLAIGFAASGNALGYLGGGWARAEPDFTWAIGSESHLILPRPRDDADYLLTLDVVPFVHEPKLRTQRLIVSVNGTVIGSSVLYRPSLLGYRFPAELLGRADKVLVTLRHPDAERPLDLGGSPDDRQLAFSLSEAKLYRLSGTPDRRSTGLPIGLRLSGEPVRSGDQHAPDLARWVEERTGLTLPQLALQFESLGENCEFGLVQRRCDIEPLGLLRFSSTFLRNLIRGLENGFDGLGDPEEIEPRLEGKGPKKEYMIHEGRFGLVYHTFVYEGQRTVSLIREQESARLKFLRRKFLEDLETGGKLFVYKRNSTVSEEEVLPLLLALHRHGSNRLLWVVPADEAHPSGTVELAQPGLFKGYIERFAPDENAHDFAFEGWMRVCANTYLLSRLQRVAE